MYKALKPCNFNGRKFYVGDTVPTDLIDRKRLTALLKYGVIMSVPETPAEPPKKETDASTDIDIENVSDSDKQAFNGEKTAAAKRGRT